MRQFMAYRFDGPRRIWEVFPAEDEHAAQALCSLRGWHYRSEAKVFHFESPEEAQAAMDAMRAIAQGATVH